MGIRIIGLWDFRMVVVGHTTLYGSSAYTSIAPIPQSYNPNVGEGCGPVLDIRWAKGLLRF